MTKSEIINHNNKQFIYTKEDEMFSVTSDSISLINFVKIKAKDKLIVDFGCGGGILSLLLSTLTTKKIIGFEVQDEIALLAKKNIVDNHLEDQITVISDKIQNSLNYVAINSVDLIITNPPYFQHNLLASHSEYKAIAKHELLLTFDDVAFYAHKILKDGGRIVLVQRVERLLELLDTLKKYRLEPKRMQFIFTKEQKPAKIVLIEAVKNGKQGLKIEFPIFRRNEK